MTLESASTIGVLGGMGPQAGVDLVDKITAETRARRDQDHLPVILLSLPQIPDRTAWLADQSAPDPAPAIVEGFLRLEAAGAGVAAMACNTAHTPALFDRVSQRLCNAGASIRVLNLIEETVDGIARAHPSARRIGVLGTYGTLSSGTYHARLKAHGFDIVSPSNLHRLTDAIFHPETGIKANADHIPDATRTDVRDAIADLGVMGADVVILGCTELPIAVRESEVDGISVVDPGRMLARALIRTIDAKKLAADGLKSES